MIHKTTRSILSVLLAALLLVTSIPLTPAFAGEVGAASLQSESGVSEGLKQVDGVYQIGSADELRKFAKRVNDGETTANAILTANIDLSSVCGPELNDGSSVSWTPIGTYINSYKGTFDGAGHTISGLYINSSSDSYQGLFGYVDPGGTVQNLTVSGSVSGNNYVGGVVGYNDEGRVKNCHNIGEVSGNRYVGGVVGQNNVSSTVENCTNTGKISGTGVGGGAGVGGVVGGNDSGTVKNCYNTGKVTGSAASSNVGGVVGDNGGTVENCYNTGAVSGGEYVGGVVGWNSFSVTVTNCYNTGKVSGNRYVGGVVGYNSSSSTVTGCYFLKQNPEIPGIGGGETTGATAVNDLSELCKALESNTTWTTSPFCEHPVLQANPEGGLGTAAHPYEIKTAAQLETFRDIVNGANEQVKDSDAHAKLMNNIDLSSVCGEALDGGQPVSWTPIGNSESTAYTGTFDGNGKTIENLYINNTSSDYQGLFGRVNGGTVQDLTVSGSVNVTGNGGRVGGVVGYNYSGGNVTNCYNTGGVKVTGNDGRVGGVVGWNSGNVTNCYNTGGVKVTGNGGRVGGVVGWNDSGANVENCYNTGSGNSVGGNSVDGVVGYNDSSASVANCYYQTGKGATVGVGGTTSDNSSQTEVKSLEDFHSGEVAYLLEQKVADSDKPVWGQRIGEDDFPVLFADPNKTVYQVKINLKDSADSSDTLRYTNSDLKALTPESRKGYTFDGWYESADCSGEAVTTITDLTDTTATLYAKWTANEYTVTLNTDGGTIAEEEEFDSYTYGVGAKLPAENEITKTGHTFAGWYEKEDLTGDPVIEISATDTGEKEYWAKWTPNTYQVTLHTNDGTIAEGQNISSYTYGIGATLPTSVTREGYTFAGWYEKEDFTGDPVAAIGKDAMGDKTYWAKWEEVENPEPDPTPTPTPDPEPTGPSTGDSTGWDDILDEIENTENGDEITIDMGDETKVPAEIFESLAGKDVDVTFDLGDIQWSVNGADIPTDTDFTDLDLGASLGTSGIPVNVINTITGEVGTVQITLAHNGEFGFTMTLTAPLGKENAGYWANLYHYDEDAEALNFEAAAKIDEDGDVTIPFSHASQYAIVIDTHSHATVDVSDIFVDVAPDAWYKDAVQYAYDNGLMTGVSADAFAPEATTTRAMIVSILARLEGVTTAQAAGFADVDDNDWYATAVNWAANVGVVNGYEDNTFQPNTAITREQLAAILMNYAAYKGYDVSARADLSHYSDADSISSWANDVLLWAVAEGLLTGVTDDTIAPQAHATRAQVAAILQRFLSE